MIHTNTSYRIRLAVVLTAVLLTGRKSASANDDPLASRARGRMVVSILWFENRAGTDAAHWRYGLKGSIGTAINQVKAIRAPNGVGYARHELGLEKGSALTVEQARKIGEIVEAQRVVWGSYQGSSNSWEVTAFVQNVANGEVSDPISASGTDWFDLRDTLVQQILEQLKINPSDEDHQKLLLRPTQSAQAYEWFVKAYAHKSEDSPLSVQEAHIRQALQADPDFAEAHTFLAAILGNQGAYEKAQTGLRRAIEIKPDLALAHHILGVIHLLRKQDQQALSELQEALRLEPDDADTLGRLSEFYAIKEQWMQATAYAEEAVTLAPLDAEFHAQLGWIWLNQRDRDQAMRELKEAERLVYPDAPGYLNTEQKISQAYRLLGEIPLAVKHYERFVTEAQKIGQNPKSIAPFAETLQHMKATLVPTFVEAEMPRSYTKQTLQKTLQENLTPAELDIVVNPISCNPEISQWARELTAGTTNEIDKAKAIFDELIQRIQLEGGRGKRTAKEVFSAWDDPDQVFCCQEFTKLYLALAREVGIQVFYVHLGRDYRGKLVFHDCAIIFVDDKALLVDPAYRWFGVPHQEFTVLDDVQTVAHQLFQHTPGERSVARCRVAAKLHPDFAWGQLCLATALQNADHFEEAIKALEKADQLEPGRWDVHRLRGRIAAQDKDWDTAMAQLNKALALNPDNAQTHFLLGTVLAGQGKEMEAREAYRTCLIHGPRAQIADEARRAIVQINERVGVESSEEFATAEFLVAVAKGKTETVRQMLSEGMDANSQETSGTTALMVAARYGHLDIVRLLLVSGTDVNLRHGPSGETALMIAAHRGHERIIGAFLDADADANAARHDGMTALHGAAQSGHTEIVKLLLAAGADVHAVDKNYGVTPLLFAVQNGHSEVIQLLLAADADLDAGIQQRQTVLDIELQNENVIVRRVAHIKGNDARLFLALDPHWSQPEFDTVPYRHPDDMTKVRQTYKRLMASGIDEVIVWELSVGAGGLGVAVPFSKGYAIAGYGEPDGLKKLVMMQKILKQINKRGLEHSSVRKHIRKLIINEVNEDYFEDQMMDTMINKLRVIQSNVDVQGAGAARD